MPIPDLTITDLVNYAETHYEIEGKGPTLKNCQSQRWRIDEVIGEIDARTFGRKDVDYAKAKWGRDIKPGTINNLLMYVIKGYKMAWEYGEIEHIPKIPIYKLGNTNARTGFFEVGDVKPLLEFLECDVPVQHIVQMGLFSGMRTAEIRDLTWDEVRVDGIYLEARRTKARRARRIPYNDELISVLTKRRKLGIKGLPNVFHKEKRPIKQFHHPFKKAVAKLGKPTRCFHDCRRTYALRS